AAPGVHLVGAVDAQRHAHLGGGLPSADSAPGVVRAGSGPVEEQGMRVAPLRAVEDRRDPVVAVADLRRGVDRELAVTAEAPDALVAAGGAVPEDVCAPADRALGR